LDVALYRHGGGRLAGLRAPRNGGVRVPLLLFAVQLALNMAWSCCFRAQESSTGVCRYRLAGIAIAATLVRFGTLDGGRSFVGALSAWVTFAARSITHLAVECSDADCVFDVCAIGPSHGNTVQRTACFARTKPPQL
jgi:hypothetical protein